MPATLAVRVRSYYQEAGNRGRRWRDVKASVLTFATSRMELVRRGADTAEIRTPAAELGHRMAPLTGADPRLSLVGHPSGRPLTVPSDFRRVEHIQHYHCHAIEWAEVGGTPFSSGRHYNEHFAHFGTSKTMKDRRSTCFALVPLTIQRRDANQAGEMFDLYPLSETCRNRIEFGSHSTD